MKFSILVSKIRKRTIRFLSTRISYNSKYRPVGVSSLQQITYPLIDYSELSPPYVSTLNLSAEFISKCSPSLQPVMTTQFPASYFAILKNGRVYSSNANNIAIILENNHLLEEASFQWDGDNVLPGEENDVFKVKGFTKPRKYKGNVFSLLSTGGPKYYYFMWMFELLPKLSLLRQSGYFDQVDFFLIPNYEFAYQRQYLTHFGIPEHKLINEEFEHHIQADNLMICSFVRKDNHHPKWACDFLYSSFNQHAKTIAPTKLLYIGRGDAARNRKVSNEVELIEVLKAYGFEILFLTELSVTEQARYFNAARVVVGAHGAGLGNLVYCEPGTKVLEIFPANYVRHGYHDICNQRGLEYHYLLCTPDGEAGHHSVGQRVGLTADIKAIKAMVELFLQ